MSSEKTSRDSLKELLCDALESRESFRCIEGVNPCLITLNGIKFWIYQKNITSTAFNKDSDQSDVNRIQLPERSTFQPIKDSDIAFIFLGYDNDNDVYVTWNPYTTKQRLNITKNVSLYSRKNAQQLARETGAFQQATQTNGSIVLAFPRTRLADYLLNIADYFPEMTEYVAIGSKRRKAANEAYKRFVDLKNIKDFLAYLRSKDYLKEEQCLAYFKVIKKLISDVITPEISCRKIFVKYDDIKEYTKAIVPLLNTNEINILSPEEIECVEPALIAYITYLKNVSVDSTTEYVDSKDETNESSAEDLYMNDEETDDEEQDEEGSDVEGTPVVVDPDKKYIKNGKLLRIANPDIINSLRPYLDVEYKNSQGAMNILYDYYSDRCPNMEFRDWKKLIDAIDWKNPIPVEESDESKRKKKYVIATIFPDSSYIMYKNVAQTFVESIEAIGIEEFKSLNLSAANVPVVSEYADSKYASAQHVTDSGYYVMTNLSTFQKVNMLFYAINQFHLDFKIAVIPLSHFEDEDLDFSPYIVKEPFVPKTSSNRLKIRISFSDGTFIQENQVSTTLVKAVQLAGAERVLGLNLRIGKRFFMLNHLSEEEQKMTKFKKVDENLWIDTNSDTESKYNTLVEINEKLNLGWYIEKVDPLHNNSY